MLQTLDLQFDDLAKEVKDLAKEEPELSSSIDRLRRELSLSCTVQPHRMRNRRGLRMWVPRIPLWKPVLPQFRLPARLRTGIPSTVLRRRGANKNGTLSGVGAELQVGVQHIADSIRARLLDLRKKLQRFHDEFALISELMRLSSLSAPGRS